MKQLHVVAAAIFGTDGRLLISRRHDHLHQGGLLEFPGGKVDPGESVTEALVRELREELGITPTAFSPLIQVPYDYPDKRVLLDVWRVTAFTGEPQGMEGQPLYWLGIDQLDPSRFPAANRPIITALQLPQRYLITGQSEPPEAWLRQLEQSLKQGIRLVQMRAHQWPDEVYCEMAPKALELCRRFGARLLLNRELQQIDALQADGVHLNSHVLKKIDSNALAVWRRGLVGASCHSPSELRRARELGVDYALLSPVKATASHPEALGLGWQRFAEWLTELPFPVYALGGVDESDITVAVNNGGQGVAGIRAFWPEA